MAYSYNSAELFFDIQLLPRTIPFFVVYIVVAYVLFPIYTKTHRLWYYLLGSLAIVISVSCIWSFFFRPLLPLTDMEKTADLVYSHANLRTSGMILQWVRWLYCFILCFMVFIVSSAILFVAFTAIREREHKEIEKEKTDAELKLLKYQLNPHFQMNTLNNIHALIGEDPEKAQEAVRLLAQLLRYMYHEINENWVDLQKEIKILHSYISLMELRYLNTVDVRFDVPEPVPNVKIAPAIFTNLVENAFKFGVSYNTNSYVYVNIAVKNNQICCEIRNSKPMVKPNVKSSGFGLDSLRKRLDLIYPKQYLYDVQDTENEYFVKLIIPIK